MARLMERYKTDIVPRMREKCGRTNVLSLPRLEKIVLSMGMGRAATQGEKAKIDEAVKQLTMICGQRPVVTTAKTSVAAFRLREGMKIGAKVTLRGSRMYEFLDRLVTIALPRVRDFRGVNTKSFDGHGNYSLGVTEQSIFPEIDADKLQFSQGMNITFVVRNASDEESLELLREFGVPFRTT
ncbi:MAG: 50S ribosomal protein L5 [Planctomycetia bacterium]